MSLPIPRELPITPRDLKCLFDRALVDQSQDVICYIFSPKPITKPDLVCCFVLRVEFPVEPACLLVAFFTGSSLASQFKATYHRERQYVISVRFVPEGKWPG